MFEEKKSLNREEKKIRKQASLWLAERDGGWPPERAAAFEAWKSEDIRHEIAVRELEESWTRLHQLSYLVEDSTFQPNVEILSAGLRARKRKRRIFIRNVSILAASLLFALGVWFAVESMSSKPGPEPVTYATTFNDYRQVTLEDGSVLELNANSKVFVNFSEDRRELQLLYGEAHFQVAKDRARPFYVEVDAVVVRAVGTAFNIRYGSDRVHVLVTEGSVTVDGVSTTRENTPEKPPTPVGSELVAGNLAEISLKTPYPVPLVSKVAPEELETILAWKGPRLFFESTPLVEAVRQFNEHNAVNIVFEDEGLGELRIGGSFLVEDVDAFLRLLSNEGSIIVKKQGDFNVVLSPAF